MVSVGHVLRESWRQRANLAAAARRSRPTFSHYGEDVLFDRLMHPGRHGTYVDVGANHPVNGSNTFALYLRGWDGLAIDPNPIFASEYKSRRKRDTYLTEGVASSAESLTYYDFLQGVYKTFDHKFAVLQQRNGEKLIGQVRVGCRPLSQMADEHLNGRHIDLLNIDCEGFDLVVLQSLDLGRYRPTVLIVEDYDRFRTFQEGALPTGMEVFLAEHGYRPLAQAGWSGIYIAEDWRDLFRRSEAFDEAKVANGYLPGQK